MLIMWSLPVHEHDMSVYLDILCFLSSVWCSFQHGSPVHILLVKEIRFKIF